MTDREKAIAYDRALEIAKAWCKLDNNDLSNDDLKIIFPELKESEDERIVDAIRKALESKIEDLGNGVTKTACIAWLEKQGEQKYIDKVEPKFKVGDWIYHNNGYRGPYLITNINKHGIELDNNIRIKIEDCYDYHHLWTIHDAKEGDVLASELCDSIILFKGIKDNNIDFYCDYDFSKIDIPGDRFAVNNGQHYGSVEDSKNFHPATKEQRDLLFSKMKESGYEWDADKKELKKISQRMILAEAKEAIYNKPACAWSQEDEKEYKYVLKFVDNILNNCGNKKDYEHCKRCYDWLKSLRPQPKQEWSEEDQNALEDVREAVVHYWGGDTQDILLYWLKSLKQRIKKEAV